MKIDLWNKPETEPGWDELKQNIPGLEKPYVYSNGYVYYVYKSSLWQSRCDGKEILELYYMENKWDESSIMINEIKDGYVYFNQYNEKYGEYSNDSYTFSYRVKTDESRSLQIIKESGSGTIYSGESSGNDVKIYAPPKDIMNPVLTGK